MSRSKARETGFPAIFQHEIEPAKRGQPTVSLPYLRGVDQRETVRVLPTLRKALKKHAPTCSTTALIALADLGLHELLTTHQTLHSHVVADLEGGTLFHLTKPAQVGLKTVHTGHFPGNTPHLSLSMPGPLSDALKRHTTVPWVALVALADWQLNRLIERKQRLTATPTEAIAAEAKLS